MATPKPYPSRTILIAASVSGLMFGFALQKGQVYLPRVIVGQLLLRDWTMMKMFLSACASSMTVHSALQLTGVAQPAVEMLRNRRIEKGLAITLLGGLLMGAGMALTGSCPGTVASQMGAGLSSASLVFATGVAGALVYALVERSLQPVSRLAKLEVEHLDRILGLPYAAVALLLASVCAGTVLLLERLVPSGLPILVASPYATSWSPVTSGVVVGLAQVPLLVFCQRSLGASSAYVTIAANVLHATGCSDAVRGNKLLAESKDGVGNHWQPALLVGAMLGGLAGAKLGGFRPQGSALTPAPLDALSLHPALLLVGGAALVFGARLAGGCTSGHGISGMSLLSLRSMTLVAGMLLGGFASAGALHALGAYGT